MLSWLDNEMSRRSVAGLGQEVQWRGLQSPPIKWRNIKGRASLLSAACSGMTRLRVSSEQPKRTELLIGRKQKSVLTAAPPDYQFGSTRQIRSMGRSPAQSRLLTPQRNCSAT